jgi:hypothetical protein
MTIEELLALFEEKYNENKEAVERLRGIDDVAVFYVGMQDAYKNALLQTQKFAKTLEGEKWKK